MKNSRRDFIKKSATLAAGTIIASSVIDRAFAAGSSIAPHLEMPFEGEGEWQLPPLPYATDALEPHIDKLTMEIHHGKHHKAYVDNMNKELKALDPKKLKGAVTFENIFKRVAKLPAALRNNAGGHYNHSLFWTLMKPNGGGNPTGKLAEAITTTYGTFDEFKKQFSDAATKRFGSGWAWLVKKEDGSIAITSTANQDNPLMNLKTIEIKGSPVLALDVWEHAYYLKNQNRRADYIGAWWNVVNWERAEELFNA
jgi:superoxide dismutase, Fe-Mn family